MMIARIWHGVTELEKADEYGEYLKKTGLVDVQATPGNHGVYLLRRDEGNQSHFIFLTLWESEESIRTFAGDDIEKARYYPEDEQYLLELEPLVKLYDVVGKR